MTDYEESQRRILTLEHEIDNLKADMTNAHELQMAVESNKVAASQAIAQNTKLKNEFEQLHQMMQILVSRLFRKLPCVFISKKNDSCHLISVDNV